VAVSFWQAISAVSAVDSMAVPLWMPLASPSIRHHRQHISRSQAAKFNLCLVLCDRESRLRVVFPSNHSRLRGYTVRGGPAPPLTRTSVLIRVGNCGVACVNAQVFSNSAERRSDRQINKSRAGSRVDVVRNCPRAPPLRYIAAHTHSPLAVRRASPLGPASFSCRSSGYQPRS